MKKQSFTVIIMLGLAAMGMTAGHGQEEGALINKNGGFEDGKGLYHITRPEAVKIDTDEAYRGQHSMRITAMEENEAKVEDPMVVAGYELTTRSEKDVYVFRCAIKTQNVNPSAPPRIDLQAGKKGSPSQTLPESKDLVFKQDMDWTAFEVKIQNIPKDCNIIGFWVRVPHQTGATVWVDEIEIRKVSQ